MRSALEGSRAPSDPHAVSPKALERWPSAWVDQFNDGPKAAGVLVPVLERASGLSLLLTRRARALKHHAGQIAFPGGRMESDDATVLETALRETEEEVGIAPQQVRTLGFLPALPTISGYAVTPVVGIVAADARLRLDAVEVERAFEVPLEFFLDPNNERWSEREVMDAKVPLLEFHYGGERVWGATASMIMSLKKTIYY